MKQYYYELLNRALNILQYGGDKQSLIQLLDEIKSVCTLEEKHITDNKIGENFNCAFYASYDCLPVNILKLNLKYYCETLWQKIQSLESNLKLPSYNAINMLISDRNYLNTDVIYQNNLQSLNVSNLLNVIDYGLSFANIIFDADTEQCEKYVTALKTLDNIFNNSKPLNSLNKLKYILETFYKIQSYIEEDHDRKKENKIKAVTISLIIEFLIK